MQPIHGAPKLSYLRLFACNQCLMFNGSIKPRSSIHRQHAASGHEVHGLLNIDTWRDIDKIPERDDCLAHSLIAICLLNAFVQLLSIQHITARKQYDFN